MQVLRSRVLAVIAGALILAGFGTGGAMAARLIHSDDIARNTIREIDLRRNSVSVAELRPNSVYLRDLRQSTQNRTGVGVITVKLTDGQAKFVPGMGADFLVVEPDNATAAQAVDGWYVQNASATAEAPVTVNLVVGYSD